jgi:hypothetical protein
MGVELVTASGTASATCEVCERPIPPHRASCLYCGWEPGQQDSTYGARVEERSYRRGATLARFLFAALAFGPWGWSILENNFISGSRPVVAFAFALLVLGPGVLLLQLQRRLTGRVDTRPEGLLFLGGRRVRWSELESAQLVHGLTGDGSSARLVRSLGSGGPVRIVVDLMITGGLRGFLLAPILFVQYFVASAILLLTPWPERVVLRRTDGSELVLRDLGEAEAFVNAINAKLHSMGRRR